MRLPVIALPLALLAGCGAMPADVASPQAAPSAPVPFVMPMDPGQLTCAQLSNPAAMDEATDWAMGQARAAVMAGRATQTPDTLTLSAGLSNYCAANRGGILRDALAHTGL